MTVQNPPAWLADASIQHNADDIRRLFSTLFFDSEGVFEADGMEVTEKGGGADMSVDVATGRCVVQGTEATYQGSYFCQNQGVTNLAIGVADASNPRIDLVVAQVRDSAYSSGDNDWRLFVVAGTAAASPSEPAVPANSYVLARVDIAALASSISNADITDRRDRVLQNKIENFMLQTGIDGSKITGTVANATTAGSATSATTATTANRWTTSRTLTVSGDMTGSVAFDGSGNIALTLSAALEAADIPNLDASKTTSGTFSTSRIPNLAASKITSGVLNANRVPDVGSLNGTTLTGMTNVESDSVELDSDGSVSSPTLRWDNDTNVGLFRAQTDALGISVGGEAGFVAVESSNNDSGSAGDGHVGINNYCGGFSGTAAVVTTTTVAGESVKRLGFDSSSGLLKANHRDFGLDDAQWHALAGEVTSFERIDHYVLDGRHFVLGTEAPPRDADGQLKRNEDGSKIRGKKQRNPRGALPLRRAGMVQENVGEIDLHLITEHAIDWQAVAVANVKKTDEILQRLETAGL